jgi:SAM-dependent methyltransferase
MSVPGATGEGQLERQSGWLVEHWTWLLDTRVLPFLPPRPSALDVGSGPGVVASALSDRLDVTCLDLDPEAVARCRSRGLRAVRGDAHALPFEDRSFDVAYCSFVLLWLHDAERALREMLRTSRHAVLLLAEPDHGGRIDHPEALGPLRELVVDGLRAEGADPLMGRKLRALCSSCGVDAQIGIHPGSWDRERARREADEEWRWIEGTASAAAPLRDRWNDALADGSLFTHSPVFYALIMK